MNSSQTSKSRPLTTPEELQLPTEDRIDLIAALLIEIICEELCTTE